MWKTLISLFLCLAGGLAAASDTRFELTRPQWNVPRSVDSVLQMPPLRQAMQQLNAQPRARLRLRYPGGDEGTLWASEVRSWLVYLGLSSTRIELLPGSRRDDALGIEILTPTIDSVRSLNLSEAQ